MSMCQTCVFDHGRWAAWCEDYAKACPWLTCSEAVCQVRLTHLGDCTCLRALCPIDLNSSTTANTMAKTGPDTQSGHRERPKLTPNQKALQRKKNRRQRVKAETSKPEARPNQSDGSNDRETQAAPLRGSRHTTGREKVISKAEQKKPKQKQLQRQRQRASDKDDGTSSGKQMCTL